MIRPLRCLSRKAQAFVWIAGLIFLFFIGLFYIVMDQAFVKVTNTTLVTNMPGLVYEGTFNKLDVLWDLMLVAATIGVIMFWLVNSLRRKTDEKFA